MKRLCSVLGAAALLAGVVGLASAQPPINDAITNSTSFTKNPQPWNNTLNPQGTYIVRNGVTKMAIAVEIGTEKNGVFTADPNVPLRNGSVGANNTWTAAAYTNLTSKKEYAVRAQLWTSTGNPPTPPAVTATDIKIQTIP